MQKKTDYVLLTRKQVQAKTGITTSSLYRLMREGSFPLPLKISTQSVRWKSNEIEEWIATKPRATGDHPGVQEVPADQAQAQAAA